MNDLTVTNESNISSVEISQQAARSMKEVEAAIVLAKKFPRDIFKSIQNIKKNCQRKKLAEKAMYAYPRGGELVTGPSVRLAEVIAQAWGNLDFGIKEIESGDGVSLVEAYCWDYENNVRQVKQFKVPHVRYTKKYGAKKLTDPRDIYEMVANQGARRLRACILGVIPLDVVEEATEQCQKTLVSGNDKPIEDRIRGMLDLFSKFSINQEMIEKRLGHDISVTNEIELVNLGKIYNSLRDGMSKREDWFEFQKKEESETSDKLNSIVKTKNTDKKD